MESKELLERIFQSQKVQDESGTEYPYHSGISRSEGEFLSKIISRDPKITRTLEIGCAFGISSLFICSATKERGQSRHSIIDPFQNSQWHGIGIANLRRCGLSFFDLIEKPSEFALPALAEKEPGTFDFVFIDGWHTLDHTLLDLFFADRLVRIGGYIVIDDCDLLPVSKAVGYFSQFPAYHEFERLAAPSSSGRQAFYQALFPLMKKKAVRMFLPHWFYERAFQNRFSSMISFKKIGENTRPWDWYEPFF
jgi:predicted O-methyltransferase YrrM